MEALPSAGKILKEIQVFSLHVPHILDEWKAERGDKRQEISKTTIFGLQKSKWPKKNDNKDLLTAIWCLQPKYGSPGVQEHDTWLKTGGLQRHWNSIVVPGFSCEPRLLADNKSRSTNENTQIHIETQVCWSYPSHKRNEGTPIANISWWLEFGLPMTVFKMWVNTNSWILSFTAHLYVGTKNVPRKVSKIYEVLGRKMKEWELQACFNYSFLQDRKG